MAPWCQGKQPGMLGRAGAVSHGAALPIHAWSLVLSWLLRLPSGLVSSCAAGALGTSLWDAGGATLPGWVWDLVTGPHTRYTPLCG